MTMISVRAPRVQLALLLILCGSPAFAQTTEPIDFGRQIQPILAKRCFACHGPDKAEGGLRLNVKESVFSKLESEKTGVVPKHVDQSEIIRRITSTEDGVKMPPEGAPLSETQINLIKQWIEQGAEWTEHWAFIAPQRPPLPTVKSKGWVANPIDAFVLSKLEQHGLTPASPADKTALLRRVTYDLTGLPPTQAEVKSFLEDQSANAYEKVVDRLLKSERFGEHWARYWLDVVRYADTNSFERDGPKPNAWRYRDYVIRAFNSDKPYDRFIREQLAGDELPDGGSDGIIATGFYRLGQWDDEPADRLLAVYDGFDDIITTTSQGFLGLTVNCGRCHDHKIDPIPQQDYYSLLAFFRGVTPNGNPNPQTERPVFETDSDKETYAAKLKAHKEHIDRVQAELTDIEKEFKQGLDSQAPKLDPPDLDDVEYKFYRDTWSLLPKFDNLKPESVGKLEHGYLDISPATRDASFGFVFMATLKVPEDGEYTFSLDSDDGSKLTVQGKELTVYDGIHGLGQPQVRMINLKKGRIPIRVDYFQGAHGDKGLILKWSGPGVPQRYLSAMMENGRSIVGGKDQKKDFANLMALHGAKILGQVQFDNYNTLRKELEELKKHKIDSPMALCVTEVGPVPPETEILKRGNPLSPGEKVVPAFLSALGGGTASVPSPAPHATSSGRRLALANWIASPENRLTARVMMNRIWQHHFGRGIVRSPNNFGLMGDRPTHPELLDWLAVELASGSSDPRETAGPFSTQPWSMKRMHKLIVMSNTYRMSSRPAKSSDGVDPVKVDPLNNWMWRHDMRRLGAEEIRDTILAVGGDLNFKMYGPGVYPEISDEVKAGQSVPGSGWGQSSPEDRARRSVYVHMKRSLMLPILADFDIADSDTSCAARFTTTQPTQALAMLNGHFLNEQAVRFSKRLRKESPDDVRKQVALGYRLALNRTPDEDMINRGVGLIDGLKTRHGLSSEKALEQFCLMTLNLNEFIYLD